MQVRLLSDSFIMKKRYFKSRKPKERQRIPASVAATLRSYIAKTWLVIGSLRKKRDYDTNKKPWNPCLRAQQNYVAWCRKHEVNPECWTNFVYYFGIGRLFWEPFGDTGGASMPGSGISIASLELEIATGEAHWLGGYSYKQPTESLDKYEDQWPVILTARATLEDGTEDFRLKKKLFIKAESYTIDKSPTGPRWSVSFSNGNGWSGPRHRSRTVIEYLENPNPTKDSYSQWWNPVLAALKPGSPLNRNLHVQVQPLTHRGRHEIRNNLFPYYGDDYDDQQ